MPNARKELKTADDFHNAIGAVVVSKDGAEGTIAYNKGAYYFLNNRANWDGSYPKEIRDSRYKYSWYLFSGNDAYEWKPLYLKSSDSLLIGELK